MYNPIRQKLDQDAVKILRLIFQSQIKTSFLFEIRDMVAEKLNKYDLTGVFLPIDSSEVEVCRLIVGAHRGNNLLLSDDERVAKEKDPSYREALANQVCENVRLRKYAGMFVNGYPSEVSMSFLNYTPAYTLFAICYSALEKYKSVDIDFSSMFKEVFQKGKAVLLLMGDGLFESAYSVCKDLIEEYVKFTAVFNDNKFDVCRRFEDFVLDKEHYSDGYSNSFLTAYQNRTASGYLNKDDYMEYGFVDSLKDYHSIVKENPYSLEGCFEYVSKRFPEYDFEILKQVHKACKTNAHTVDINSSIKEMSFMELTAALANIIIPMFEILCDEVGLDTSCEGIELVKKARNEYMVLKGFYDNRKVFAEELRSGKLKNSFREI